MLEIETAIAAIIALLYLTRTPLRRWIFRQGHSSKTVTSERNKQLPEPVNVRAEDSPPSPEVASIYQQLQGTWSLVSYEVKIHGPLTITRYPFGKSATGLILYTSDGYMSAQLMGPGAQAFAANNYHDGSESEMTNAARHYLAYSGSYSVNIGLDLRPLLKHVVEVSLYPNWLGTTQSRICEISDTELTLTPDTLPSWKVGILHHPVLAGLS